MKDEILTQIQGVATRYFRGDIGAGAYSSQLTAALDRYAFSIVEQSVPVRRVNEHDRAKNIVTDTEDVLRAWSSTGWNDCRDITLLKARELTNQPLTQEK